VSGDWIDELRERLEELPEEFDGVLRQVVDEVTGRLGADRGTLYLYDRVSNRLVSRVAHLPEIAEIRLRLGEGIAGEVARSGQILALSRAQQDSRFAKRIDAITGYRTENILAAPVRDSDQHILGVLQVLNKRGGDFDEQDKREIERLSAIVGQLLKASSLGSQLVPQQFFPLSFHFNNIIGESAVMQDVYQRTTRAAATDVTVLLRGESGSGKELFAQAIHYNSNRRDKPFVKVDCASLPESLIENELFGHVKGAFTSADEEGEGKVEAARGGTLFLDEVGEVSRAVQLKLLRLLQDKVFTRVGSNRPREADVRFVCATNRDLEAAVAKRAFRQDLYYRVRVVEIQIPTLRERGHGDLCRLGEHFLAEACSRYGREGMRLSPEAIRALHTHEWPGNVRELKNCIESAVVLASSETIERDHLPISSSLPPMKVDEGAPEMTREAFVTDLRSLREVELDYIEHVLDAVGGNRSAAARLLGIGRNTLLRKLKSRTPR